MECSDDDNTLPDELSQATTADVSAEPSTSQNSEMPVWSSGIDNSDNHTTLLAQSQTDPNIQISQGNPQSSDGHGHDESYVPPVDNTDNDSAIDQGISMSQSEPRNTERLSVGKLSSHNVLQVSKIMPVFTGNNDIEEFTLPDDILILHCPNNDQIKMSVYSCTGHDECESNIVAVDFTNEDFSDFSVPEDILTSDSEYIAAQFEDLLDS